MALKSSFQPDFLLDQALYTYDLSSPDCPILILYPLALSPASSSVADLTYLKMKKEKKVAAAAFCTPLPTDTFTILRP